MVAGSPRSTTGEFQDMTLVGAVGSDTINMADLITVVARVTGISSTSPVSGENGVAVTKDQPLFAVTEGSPE